MYLIVHSSSALEGDKISHIDISADSISYEKEKSLITASKNVEVQYDGKVLNADHIAYLQKEQRLNAKGNVVLHGSDGTLMHSHSISLDAHSSSAEISNFTAKLANKITISAEKAVQNEHEQIAYNMRITPCIICAESIIPWSPLWQLRTQKATLNEHTHTLQFEKATLDFLNKPILPISRFTLPMPNAKPKSGFLLPNIEFSKVLGVKVAAPYYFRIDHNMDATLTPTFYTKAAPLYGIEFRHLLKNGQYQIQGSIAPGNNNATSSHIKVKGDFDAIFSGKQLNYGMKVNKLFDKTRTYLKKYEISDDEILTTHLYLENSSVKPEKSHWLSLESLSFQDLRTHDHTSSATPLIRYNHFQHLDSLDAEMHISSKAYHLHHVSGLSDIRVSTDAFLTKEMINNYGYVAKLKSGFTSYIHQHRIQDISRDHIHFANKNIIPYAQAKLSLPLFLPNATNIIFEPISAVTLSPNHFVSEDYELLETRAVNFFEANRFLDWSSSDLLPRLDYGARVKVYGRRIRALSLFLGGSTYFQTHPAAGKRNNDYTLNAHLQLNRETHFLNRIQLDQRTGKIVQHEIDSIVKFPKMSIELSYSYRRAHDTHGAFSQKNYPFPQEASGNINFNVYKKWWLGLSASAKLNKERGEAGHRKILRDGVEVSYRDDCLHIGFTIKRDHTAREGLEPSTAYLVKVSVPILSEL